MSERLTMAELEYAQRLAEKLEAEDREGDAYLIHQLLAEVIERREAYPPRPSPGASAEDGAREAKRVEEIRRDLHASMAQDKEADWRACGELLAILDARAARESERERALTAALKTCVEAMAKLVAQYESEHDPEAIVRPEWLTAALALARGFTEGTAPKPPQAEEDASGR